MSNRITLDELQSFLWNSAVLLRTHIDAGAYKQYIFPLMFFKRICDVYDEECAEILKEYDGDAAALEWEENHRFVIPKGYHWKEVRSVSENVGVAIVNAFRAIEKANHEQLHGVFGDGAWTNKNRLPDKLLKDLIEHFSSKTLSVENCPEDELGQGYEYLIKKFADDSGHTAQEFYTNRTVVHLMTAMLKPQPGESIYDPTCGSAGMLISAIAYLKKQGLEWRNVKVYGQEINALTSAIGRMNLFLHGIKDFNIVNDDTLKNPAFIENGQLMQFDLVLANPPYSINQWDRVAFSSDKFGRNSFGTPPQSRADYAFIQHIIKSLKSQTGRCAILLPHGVLNRTEEQDIRRVIVKSDCIEAVIGLGRHLFYNSGLESCILICRMNKQFNRRGHILFIEAEKCLHKEKTQSYLYPDDIQKIATAYKSDTDIPGFSKFVSIDKIMSNNGNLNIKLYVHENDDAVVTYDDTDQMLTFLQNYIDSSDELKEVFCVLPEVSYPNKKNNMEAATVLPYINRLNWEQVKLGDVAEEYSIRVNDPSLSEYEWYIGSDCIDGFDYSIRRKTSAKKIKSTQKAFQAGDYLLVRRSLYGSDFRERAPRASFEGVCSADILTIREKPDKISDGFLIAILYSKKLWDFIVANSTGSLTRRIKWSQLKDFEFDLPTMNEQKRFSELLWTIYDAKEAYKNLLSLTGELVKAQFLEMFGDPVTNPMGWPVMTMKNASLRLSDGPFGSNLKSEHYCSEGVRVIRLQNIGVGEFIDDDKAYVSLGHYQKIKKYTCKSGDIVIGTLGDPNFRACVIPDSIEIAVNKADCVHYVPKPDILNTVFVCQYINYPSTITLAQGSIHGNTRQRISSGQVALLPIFVPHLDLQNQFSEFVQQINKSKPELQQTISSLENTIRSLMLQFVG